MKKILFVAFIAGATLLSCSKKKNPVPANTVSINGTTYSTVKIGTQTWTSVNYRGLGGTNYNDSQTIDTIYGKLYTLAEAQDAAKNLPTGWHLPTKADMETLLKSVDAKGTSIYGTVLGDSTVCSKLRSTSDWLDNINGNNSSGFNAYPAGMGIDVGNYSFLSYLAAFWTSSAGNQNSQYYLNITGYSGYSYSTDIEALSGSQVINFRASIRFVKDN